MRPLLERRPLARSKRSRTRSTTSATATEAPRAKAWCRPHGGRGARTAEQRRRPRDSGRWRRSSSDSARGRRSRARCLHAGGDLRSSSTAAAQMGVAIANSRIYARMKERDRLAALGSMAAGLAHEVKGIRSAPSRAPRSSSKRSVERAATQTRSDQGVPRHHSRGNRSAEPRRRKLPRLRASARRQPRTGRHQRRGRPATRCRFFRARRRRRPR